MDDRDAWPTGRLLSTAARLVEHAWNERLATHGLTHAGVIALSVLGEGPLPQTRMAVLCQVEDQTMSRTLERLEREGYVVRERDVRDRRRVLVSRTGPGTEVVRMAHRLEREVVPQVSDPERFRELLFDVVEALHGERFPREQPRVAGRAAVRRAGPPDVR